MARYGGGKEDFDEQAAKLNALSHRYDEVIAKEQKFGKGLEADAALESRAARAARLRTQARKEGQELATREAAVEGRVVTGTNLDTAAIERNTAARRRNAAIRAQQAKLLGTPAQAVSGARDPAFAQAHRLAEGGSVTQYRIRQQLEGVGQRRAADLQAAVQRGFRPVEGPRQADRPLSRQRAAALDLERSEAALVEANRTLANTRRRAGASDEERLAALGARDAARAQREAAKLELQSAERDAAARSANASALRSETAAHERAAASTHADAVERDRARGRDIVRHSTLYGTGAETTRDYTETERRAAGRYVPVQPVRERGAAGSVGGGDEKYDEAFARNREAAAAALEKQAAAAAAASEQMNRLAASEAVAAREAAALEASRVTSVLDNQSAATMRQQRALQASGVAYGTVSDAMHRHGALTTEFINAAARGETTMRELGNQSLATAGKFAGWTAAGAALYTAVDAIRQLGAGAVHASDGVTQLQRVIPGADRDQTIAAFAQLSDQFNVPIEVAADAVYRMGQRFHTLPEAVEAARSSLYSFKTGEVDVATSTSSLLAIVNGFGLSASELTNVYDQINQAQNKFGIGISDTEAGLAKAGGAFRNSGGDLSFLLGLFVAISRATNRSGQEIGTGLARGVSQIRLPSHQAALRSAGVNADPENLQTTIQSALKVARRPGADVNAIASAILGNQYARLLAPVLRDQTLLNQALQDTSPEESKGSAQRELAKVLSEVSEQAHRVGTNLQIIGAQLARSGAAAPFVGLLKGLNLVLNTTGDIIGLFNRLPSGLRESVAVVGELAIAVAALRKFGATDRLVGGPLGFLANPDKRLKAYATRGLRDAENEAKNELQSSSRREYRLRTQAAAARYQVEDFARSPTFTSTRHLDIEDPARRAAQAELLRLEGQALQAERAAAAAAAETNQVKRGVVYQQQQLAELQALEARQVRAQLAASRTPVPVNLNPQNTAGITRLTSAQHSELALAAAHQSVSASPDARDVNRLIGGRAATPRIDQAESRARRALLERSRQLGQLGNAEREFGRTAGLLGAGLNGVVTASAGAARFTSRIGSGFKSAGGGLARLAGSLGALDLALLGFIAVEAIGAVTDKLAKDVDANDRFLRDYTGKTERARAALAAKAREANQAPDITSDYLSDTGRLIGDFTAHLPKTVGRIFGGDYETPGDRRTRVRFQTLQRQADQKALEARQRAQVAAGEPRTRLGPSDLLADIQSTARDRRSGLINLVEFDKRMALYAQEASHLLKPTKIELAKVRRVLAEASSEGTAGGYKAAVGGLDSKGLAGEMERVAAQIQAYGGNATRTNQLREGYRRAVELNSGGDAESVKALSAARDLYFNTLQSNAEAEIQAGLESAPTEGGRQGVFRTQIQRLRQALGSDQTAVRRYQANQRRAERDLAAAQRRLRSASRTAPSAGGPLGGLVQQGGVNRLERDAARLESDVERYKNNYSKFRRELRAARRRLNEIIAKLRDVDAYEDREAGRQSDLSYQQSLTRDPVRQAAAAVESARKAARDANRTFSRRTAADHRRRQDAQTAVNEARNSQLDAQKQAAEDDKAKAEERRQKAVEHARLVGELASARAGGDPVASARAAQNAARVAGSTASTQNDRLQALVDMANANNQLQQALTEREDARFDLLASTTEDPVKQARIARQRAAYDLAHATGPTDKLQKRAAYNRSIQDYRNARLDDRREEINFDLQMGKITSDTAADLVQSLARTKNLSKKAKRELLLEAKRLRDEASGDYELNLDSLKLPTLYEIRRAVVGGQRGASITNQYRTSIHVSDNQSALKVGEQMERYHTGALRATARAVGRR